jgi:hypothetical protein
MSYNKSIIRSLQSIPPPALPQSHRLLHHHPVFIRNTPSLSFSLEATEFFKNLHIICELEKLDHVALQVLHQVEVEAASLQNFGGLVSFAQRFQLEAIQVLVVAVKDFYEKTCKVVVTSTMKQRVACLKDRMSQKRLKGIFQIR